MINRYTKNSQLVINLFGPGSKHPISLNFGQKNDYATQSNKHTILTVMVDCGLSQTMGHQKSGPLAKSAFFHFAGGPVESEIDFQR